LASLTRDRDRVGHRGPFVLLAITWNVISYICLRTEPYDSGKWYRYAVLAIANVSYASMQYVYPCWAKLTLNTDMNLVS
jgi:hypothetical protein